MGCFKLPSRYLVSVTASIRGFRPPSILIAAELGGVTNFCFGKCSATNKEMFVCAEQRLWRLQFGGEGESQLQMERSGWME